MAEGAKISGRPLGKTARSAPALWEFDAGYLRESGIELLAGIDEAGRGALAGPVVVGAVVLDGRCRFPGLNDSKQLSPGAREELYQAICAGARGVGIGWASAGEIDRLNVLEATLLAAERALEVLPVRPDMILTDFLKIRGVAQPVEPLVKGDARSQAIAAASVVAKVTRDRWMRVLDAEYPVYEFASHKGYGAPKHLDALARHGSSTIHRHSFRGVDWFESEYRRSGTLMRLLGEIEQGALDPAESDETWRGSGYWLPECERLTFKQAVEARALRDSA